MQIFLDSARLSEIQEAYNGGIISGVTTNPSLVAKELIALGKTPTRESFQEYIQGLCSACTGLPISLQVTEPTAQGMIRQGKMFYQWSCDSVVKVPLSPAGLAACKVLTQEGISVNVTLCFSVSQALLAAQAGATYISAFWGRLEDHGGDGFTLIEEIRTVLEQSEYSAQVLAASIRTQHHARQAALAGAHIATIPWGVLQSMFNHPLTTQGIKTFSEDSVNWAACLACPV